MTAAVILAPFVSAGADGLESLEVTAHSVTLAWTAVGDDGLDGSAAAYDVRYAVFPITEGNFHLASVAADPPAPLPAGLQETCEILGLEPSTQYYFAVRVGDEAGNWSGLSNVIVRTTEYDLSAISDLNAFPGDAAGEIDLTWTDPPEITDTAAARRYQVHYAEYIIDPDNLASTFVMDTSAPVPSAGQPQQVTLTGLVPGQLYYVTVQVYDGFQGLSPLSNNSPARAGSDITTDLDDNPSGSLPEAFRVFQNYPNPFNPTTVIAYSLSKRSRVSVDVFNALGQRVARLVDCTKAAGRHEVEWGAVDDSGHRVASGVYFYRIEIGETIVSRKMILLR